MVYFLPWTVSCVLFTSRAGSSILENMSPLRDFIEKLNAEAVFAGQLRYDEPMAAHTTFKVGGPADVWVQPRGDCFTEYAAALLRAARAEGIPVFILGGGANLVVSDRGIRGIVLDTTGYNEPLTVSSGQLEHRGSVKVPAGMAVDALTDALAGEGWGGLEFLAGMPGSVGGAVWMNARCYEKSISDVLMETEILNEHRVIERIPFNPSDFDYKRSPFQNRDVLIRAACFRLEKKPLDAIRREMEAHLLDRKEKGHYRFPSAGSVFKNNREFGKPTGKIIDELGLRGLQSGGAQVAPFHGNIIINTGNATAADIRSLTDTVRGKVRSALGIELESEILFAGDWGQEPCRR
ncbi:UDP-N-acetylenolpyruvoylglucosamine reductase [Spirochaetia bacterium]|nr:UDP-N-acetylenolpyruvoylglucosamine reductase [Spirochaetia bacterium]